MAKKYESEIDPDEFIRSFRDGLLAVIIAEQEAERKSPAGYSRFNGKESGIRLIR